MEWIDGTGRGSERRRWAKTFCSAIVFGEDLLAPHTEKYPDYLERRRFGYSRLTSPHPTASPQDDEMKLKVEISSPGNDLTHPHL